ncbi:HinT-interacting membrane complex protein P80 [Mycoplasma crocodyli]|uniref:Putative membrane protein P80 n=1 Tax=Mycoplasma crocodyli (strain ATCC 51981 / MP145) TaxID=512564 RepID=D5E6F1_MYCCM|nr:hypothetical protein [Mycoplasma crocodyli]ADE19993.1 putative membrane protein P80 [Mycoplasma crocodyli MP145]
MAKQRKSFFEKLTELNTSHEESKKVKSIKKKKNFKIWITLGALAVVVASAITIPLVINTTKVNYKPARANDQKVLEFINDKGEKVSINVEQLTNDLKSGDTKIKEKNEELYKKAIFYLYEQEQKASVKFQRIWNFSREIGEQENNNIALKSIEEVRKAQKDKLNDVKRTTQNNYGFENWEKQFTTQLASEEYGKSTSEEEAIEFLVFKEIEHNALRSFQLENANDTLFKTKKDINRVASADIFEVDSDGNKVLDKSKNPIIIVKKGDKSFKEFVKEKNYFEVKDSEKIITLKTRSFIPQKWNVDPFIDDFLKNNTPYVSSLFTIPGVPPTLLSTPWTVDKDKYINLALYSIVDNKVVLNGSLISKFKNIEDYVLEPNDEKNKDKALYENYLNALSSDPDELKKNLGSSGVTSLTQLFKNDNASLAMAMVNDLFETNTHKLPEVDLETLFKENYNTSTFAKIAALLAETKTIETEYTSATEETKKAEALNKLSDKTKEINTIIKTYLTQIKSDEFNTTIGENYKNTFVKTHKNEEYLSFAYNVKGAPGVKAIITQGGISLLTYKKVDTKEKFMKLLKSDLVNLSESKPDYFKTLQILNASLTSKNSIIDFTLQDSGFDSYLKTQTNIFSEDKKQKYNDQDLNNLKNSASSIRVGELRLDAYNALEKSLAWIKGLINTKTSFNFQYKDGKYYIDYDKAGTTSALSTNTAKEEILKRILAEFKIK